MNIVIVDDHPLVRQGLSAMISLEADIKLVGEASNGADAVNLILAAKPEVALIDLRLNDASGLDVIRTCKEKVSFCKYVILTSSVDSEDFRRAGELGVEGYVLKEAFPEEILAAIRVVSRGRKYYDPGLVDSMMNRGGDPLLGHLSSREREILTVLGEGLTNKEIAQKLIISENTVKKHVSQVLAKLELSDRTQAALYARNISLRYGMVAG